jgi:hypothetical protein
MLWLTTLREKPIPKDELPEDIDDLHTHSEELM